MALLLYAALYVSVLTRVLAGAALLSLSRLSSTLCDKLGLQPTAFYRW
jgi:hypothetical protein